MSPNVKPNSRAMATVKVTGCVTVCCEFFKDHNLKNVNFVEVESATAKAVQNLLIRQEAECPVTGYCQQVVGNECVNLT